MFNFDHIKIPIDAVWAAGGTVVAAGAGALGLLWSQDANMKTDIATLETKVERYEEDLSYIRTRTDDIYQYLLQDKEKTDE